MPIQSYQLATKSSSEQPINSMSVNGPEAAVAAVASVASVDGATSDNDNNNDNDDVNVNVNKLPCFMCGKSKPHALVDLSDNIVMRRTLNEFWHLRSEDLETTLRYICVQCVYKINACKEVTRSLQIRLHRLNEFSLFEHEMLNESAIKSKDMNQKMQQTLTSINEISKNCNYDLPILKCNTSEEPPRIEITSLTPKQQLPFSAPVNRISKSNNKQEEYNNKKCTDTDVSISIQHSTPNGTHMESDGMQLSPVSVRKKQRERYVVQVEDVTPVRDIPLTVGILPASPFKNSSASSFELNKSPVVVTTTSETMLRSQSNSSSPQNNLSMLQIASERTEFALITESGGKINKYKRRPQRAAVQFVCTICSRSYWRKDFYAKHIRKCQARNRVAAAAPPVVAKQTVQNGTALRLANQSKFNFHCNQCANTYSNRTELAKHKRTHFQQFVCKICDSEFDTKYGYEIHAVICDAKTTAINEISLSSDNVKNEHHSRVTRARSVAANTTTTTKRAAATSVNGERSIYTEYENSVYDVDENDSDDNDDDDDGDDDNDDLTSVADTMYTKRMRFTGDWVEVQSNSNSRLSLCENFYDYDIDAQISSYKEYDLYLLDKLKRQIQTNFFTSFAPNCSFTTNSLIKLMAHDYLHHFRRAWFYCRKCGRVFTSKIFLDYHLDRQNGGRYICYKCGDIFEFQHQLDRHIIRHTKCINYRCNYCNFEFLTEHELLRHCEIEKHDPNSERKLICIDPSMTITNLVPAACKSNKNYAAEHGVDNHNDHVDEHAQGLRHEHFGDRRICIVKMIDMHLPKVPSLRPMNLPGHKPYRRLIGDVEFKNQKNPNCWGWK